MTIPRPLLERWTSAIKKPENCVNTAQSINDVSSLSDIINSAVTSIAIDAIKDDEIHRRIAENITDLDLIALVRNRYESQRAVIDATNAIKGRHDNICSLLERLTHLRAQEDWASFVDHARTLLFRLLTTVMIAGVILSTGYISKTYDIPLPMLRAPSP